MFLDRLPRNRAHGCLILSLAERGQKRAGAGCNRQCSFESSSRAPFNHSCGKQVPLKSKASAPFFVPCPGKNRVVFMQVDACYCLSSSRPSCRCYSRSGAGKGEDSLERGDNWPNFYSSFLRRIYWNRFNHVKMAIRSRDKVIFMKMKWRMMIRTIVCIEWKIISRFFFFFFEKVK